MRSKELGVATALLGLSGTWARARGLDDPREARAAYRADLGRPRVSGVLLRLAALGAWILVASQLLVWSRLSVLRARYELSAARQMVSELEEQLRQLQIEAELLRDPANLAKEARGRLGMRPPQAGDMVCIR